MFLLHDKTDSIWYFDSDVSQVSGSQMLRIIKAILKQYFVGFKY